jgi:WD40 repeat protein
LERKKIGWRKRGGHYNATGLDWAREITGPNDIISTMDLSIEDMFAMGTWGRKIAIYAAAGRGELITTFSPMDVEASGRRFGEGISQVKWSPCGRYLYVAERSSTGIHMYDIRGAGRRVGCLMGREANTAVKLAFDIVTTAEGSEVWAGGTDGKIRMWKNPEQRGGVVSWDEEWAVHGENDLVCATLVHGSGSVVATVACKERYDVDTTYSD